MRPDAVDKGFPGGLVDANSFDERLGGVAFDPARLVLVARPQDLFEEWRLVIANGEVIAASQYRAADRHVELAGCPQEVRDFTHEMLKISTWTPAPIFVLDVCNTDDGLRLLEVNSFGCSGHYLADVVSVVESASRLARLAW